MIEDKLLIYRFKRGSRSALQRIYEKYRGYLLTIATALLNDANSAEDVIHDFFVSFAQSAEKLRPNGSLKCYLAICVVNRAKDKLRAGKRLPVICDCDHSICSNAEAPESSAICNEELQLLKSALNKLPYKQREVVMLHIKGQMKFKKIAKLQSVSIKTVQSRYRYALDKLRIILDGQV